MVYWGVVQQGGSTDPSISNWQLGESHFYHSTAPPFVDIWNDTVLPNDMEMWSTLLTDVKWKNLSALI